MTGILLRAGIIVLAPVFAVIGSFMLPVMWSVGGSGWVNLWDLVPYFDWALSIFGAVMWGAGWVGITWGALREREDRALVVEQSRHATRGAPCPAGSRAASCWSQPWSLPSGWQRRDLSKRGKPRTRLAIAAEGWQPRVPSLWLPSEAWC